MKILWLDHGQMDLGAFNQFTGLCEILGYENIITFPYKRMYYKDKEHFNSGYVQFLREYYLYNKNSLPYGIPPFQPGEDIINGYPDTVQTPYIISQPKKEDELHLSEDQIIEKIKKGEFRFIVLASGHRSNTMALARIRDRMGGLENLPPLVYIDNGERDEFNAHWWYVFRPKINFKLILTQQIYQEIKDKYSIELYPLPQSNPFIDDNSRKTKDLVHLFKSFIECNCETDDFDDEEKRMDIYYALGHTYDKRKLLKEIIAKYIKEKDRTGTSRIEPYDKFMSNYAHSKIGVSMRGSGRDTTRYWEIPTFHTALFCDGTMGCMHPHPFEDGKTAIFYNENELEKVPEILDYYLNNPKERKKIANSGYEWVRSYHTIRKRAEYFLNIVERELRQI